MNNSNHVIIILLWSYPLHAMLLIIIALVVVLFATVIVTIVVGKIHKSKL